MEGMAIAFDYPRGRQISSFKVAVYHPHPECHCSSVGKGPRPLLLELRIRTRVWAPPPDTSLHLPSYPTPLLRFTATNYSGQLCSYGFCLAFRCFGTFILRSRSNLTWNLGGGDLELLGQWRVLLFKTIFFANVLANAHTFLLVIHVGQPSNIYY